VKRQLSVTQGDIGSGDAVEAAQVVVSGFVDNVFKDAIWQRLGFEYQNVDCQQWRMTAGSPLE
jgi:hypothetical protein